MRVSVKRSQLSGSVVVPPSKSHSIRALLFAGMCNTSCQIENLLPSPDIEAMRVAIENLGSDIDAKNSGQVLRFIAALSALFPNKVTLTGDHSLRTNRPTGQLVDALNQLGAKAIGKYAPITVQGPLLGGKAIIDGRDSQPVSALLMACSFAREPSEIIVTNPGEKPWVDLTLHWLEKMGLPYKRDGYERYHIPGQGVVKPFSYHVPGDFSSCAFPIAAALVTGSRLTVNGLDMSDVQGDKRLIETLIKMGATIEQGKQSLTVCGSASLMSCDVDIDSFIDALPILAVVCCFAKGTSRIRGAAMARKKESDRVTVIAHELKKMGANILVHDDGLEIVGSGLCGAKVSSHRDHRIAMALTVAALGARGITHVDGCEWIEKSYPHFHETLKNIGAEIEYHSVRI